MKREHTTQKGDTSVPHDTASKSQQRLVSDQLDTLIDAWNQLPDGIAPRCRKRSPRLVTAWKCKTRSRVIGVDGNDVQSAAAAALSDIPKLMAAICDSPFLHGKGWFDFSWLFGSDRNNKSHVVKIIEGNYRERSNSNRPSTAKWKGDDNDFAHLTVGASFVTVAGADRELEFGSA